MKSMHNIAAVLLSLAMTLVLACQAEPPGNVRFDSSMSDGTVQGIDRPASCPMVDPSARIVDLVLPTGATPQDRQPIRGQALGAVDVFVRAGSMISEVSSVASNGRFCVNVPLSPNTQNAIEIIPRTANGCWGQSMPATVTHRTSAVPSTTQPTSVNVARFKNVDAPDLSPASDRTAITDGQSNTSAEIRFFDLPGRYATVTVDLSGSHLISSVVVEWAPGTTDGYARKFVVMATDDVSPGTPDPNSTQGTWTTVAQKDYADGDPGGFGTQILSIPIRPARWIALVLFEDADFGPNEVFQLAEFQAYVQQSPGDSTNQDSCP